MRALTEKEKGIVLLLTKDFTAHYNARSLSKLVGLSPRGALKALKFLEQNGIAASTRIGKALIYRLSFDDYAQRLASLFLFEEAQTKALRWIKEFKEFKQATALVLFGSVLRTNKHNDIDVLILADEKDHAALEQLVREKNNILVKPLHPVWQTRSDLEKNLRKPDQVVLEITKTGIVLKGQDVIVEVLASAARRE